MKSLYIITIDMGGEDSVYFTEMTAAQAEKMKQVLRQTVTPFKVVPIKRAAGFNGYAVLMRDFLDMVEVHHR